MNKGAHLTANGLKQIIKASMNTGLSEIIKSDFSNNINPAKRDYSILYQNGFQDS